MNENDKMFLSKTQNLRAFDMKLSKFSAVICLSVAFGYKNFMKMSAF